MAMLCGRLYSRRVSTDPMTFSARGLYLRALERMARNGFKLNMDEEKKLVSERDLNEYDRV